MLPDTLAPADLQCLAGGCQAGPGDAREPRAVFLGSPTGWRKGKRKAVLLAGMRNPDQACHPPTAAPTAFKMLIRIFLCISRHKLCHTFTGGKGQPCWREQYIQSSLGSGR